MTLYEQWLQKAYNPKGESVQKTWDIYLPLEQNIYEQVLGNKLEIIKGTVSQLSERFDMEPDFVCGFVDGINESIKNPIEIEKLDENTFVELDVDFETLYKKMVEYKADHLYNLPKWDNIFSLEQQDKLYKEQKSSTTIVKGDKIGRNDACPCGSGKKYKKCCGQI